VTIRILADREPYASFVDGSAGEAATGALSGSFRFLNGPSSLDEANPDLVVMPAAYFLSIRLVRAFGAHDAGPGYIAYGPVALMAEAFDRGCADYLREPWTMAELRARLARLDRLVFSVGGKRLALIGAGLKYGDTTVELDPDERILLRLLVQNAPKPVFREAFGERIELFAHSATKLRRRFKLIDPELGIQLHAVRGIGYRLDASSCG
jgi:hypothetical protein